MINKMQLINRFTPKDTDAESNNKKEGGRKRAEPDDDFPKYTKLAEYTVCAYNKKYRTFTMLNLNKIAKNTSAFTILMIFDANAIQVNRKRIIFWE